MQPYEHFCLDIETAHAEPTEAERWMRLHWSPNKNWKPNTIGERYLEMLEKKERKLALMDASPVICVSIQTDRDQRCLHCMKAQEPTMLGNCLVEGFSTEKDMLRALRNLLNAGADEGTAIVGHNIRAFDLPKLRTAFVRNGLTIPVALVTREQPIFDIMREFGFGFSLVEDLFVSAADIADTLGIAHHKALVEGSAIPELYAAGQIDPIITYAILDVVLEYEIFRHMTGNGQDKEAPLYTEQATPLAAQAQAAAARNGTFTAADSPTASLPTTRQPRPSRDVDGAF